MFEIFVDIIKLQHSSIFYSFDYPIENRSFKQKNSNE